MWFHTFKRSLLSKYKRKRYSDHVQYCPSKNQHRKIQVAKENLNILGPVGNSGASTLEYPGVRKTKQSVPTSRSPLVSSPGPTKNTSSSLSLLPRAEKENLKTFLFLSTEQVNLSSIFVHHLRLSNTNWGRLQQVSRFSVLVFHLLWNLSICSI